MKSKKQLVVGIIIVLMLLIPTVSKANMEIKPGTTTWVNITVSDAYVACRALDMPGSSLGTDGLDPHLALNKDWGAVAYLAVSSSGNLNSTNGPGGPTVTIDGDEYTTTTGNLTGVMDFGKTTYTYTSSAVKTTIESVGNKEWRQNLIDNMYNKNSKYVELLPASATTDNTKGMAIKETEKWFSSSTGYPPTISTTMVVRQGILGTRYDSYSSKYTFGWGRTG